MPDHLCTAERCSPYAVAQWKEAQGMTTWSPNASLKLRSLICLIYLNLFNMSLIDT